MTPEQYMRQALHLARKGVGRVSPNPLVGAVVVRDGRVLSTGYHRRYGGPHAEVEALAPLSNSETRGADLYVTLEPCNHHGKTPPCTERIIQAGIGRVVVGMADPNPRVTGGGMARLREAGIEVVFGVLEAECRRLNRAFITSVTENRPWVTLKLAQTLDGKIALPDGASQWITGPEARKDVHRLRRDHDAVLTGIGTVLADDCGLDVRLVRGPSPRRIVLDSHLRIPENARVLGHADPDRTILICTDTAPATKIDALKSRGITVWVLPASPQGINLSALLKEINKQTIQSILVEAGQRVATSFLRAGLVDGLVTYVAPKLFGHGLSPLGDLGVTHPSEAMELEAVSIKRVGPDLRVEGRPHVHRTR